LVVAIWLGILCVFISNPMALQQKKVDTTWTADFVYVLGVIASDGNVSSDLRHISITSKDEQLLLLIKDILKLTNTIGRKGRGDSPQKPYFLLQFGDKNFVNFLIYIGITPNKSKSIARVEIPEKFFKDFLRGVVDGDGCIDFFYHPESSQPQIRIRIASASPPFLHWLQSMVLKKCQTLGGWIHVQKKSSVSVLTYAKADSVKILKYMYYIGAPCLTRKEKIAKNILGEW